METLAPHQQRVILEKHELDEKATRLSQFIGTNPQFDSIDKEEQGRMKEQCEIMWQYSEILGKRIAAFSHDGELFERSVGQFEASVDKLAAVLGMQAENDQRKALGHSMAYTESDFPSG